MSHAEEDEIKRHIVHRSSLEKANREYTNSTDVATPPNGVYSNKYSEPRIHFVPSTVKSTLGSPTALAIGAFSTTLTTLSMALMEWRGLSTSNVFIGNCELRPLLHLILGSRLVRLTHQSLLCRRNRHDNLSAMGTSSRELLWLHSTQCLWYVPARKSFASSNNAQVSSMVASVPS